MRRALSLLLTLAAAPVAAQTCTEPTGPIDSCVVGAWIGTSTIPDALQTLMQGMPDNVRARFSDFGRPVGMIIHEDGFFETFPLGVEGEAVFQDSRGDVTLMEMTAQTITAAGFVSAMGGVFDFCHLPGGAGGLAGQMTVTTESGSVSAPLTAPPGPMGFVPSVTYTCSGDAMQQHVALPDPIGTIIYDLTRVDVDAFTEEFRSRLAEPPSE